MGNTTEHVNSLSQRIEELEIRFNGIISAFKRFVDDLDAEINAEIVRTQEPAKLITEGSLDWGFVLQTCKKVDLEFASLLTVVANLVDRVETLERYVKALGGGSGG